MGHDGMVLFGVRSFRLPTLINVKQHVLGCALRVLASACVTVLWWFVLRLFCVCLCNMIVGVDMHYFPLGCIVSICRA